MFQPYLNLTVPRRDHNMVAIDYCNFILIGGQQCFNESYIFNAENASWMNGPKLTSCSESGQAGLVIFDNGTKVVIAAGGYDEQSTEILQLEDHTWCYGAELPYFIQRGASVQLQDTFLIVGGRNDISELDTIWIFNTETEHWTLLEERMSTARRNIAAFLVPDEFCL